MSMNEDVSEIKRRRKQRAIHVAVNEALMVVAIVAIVVMVMLVVTGHSFGTGLDVEKTGLVQIYSVPTAASITIDNELSSFARTNTSRMLTDGEHTITLTKDGYDTWTKKIKVNYGLLYRLHYPRLFLLEREKETVREMTPYKMLSVAPSRNSMLVITNTPTTWELLPISDDNVRPKILNVSNILPVIGDLQLISWSENSDKVLFKHVINGKTEWIIVNVRDVKNSINLTKTFGLNISTVKTANNSADSLYALVNGNLHQINVSGSSVSKVMISGVEDFVNYGGAIIYVTTPDVTGMRSVGIYKEGEQESTIFATTTNPTDKILLAINSYYGDEYLVYTVGSHVYIYEGELPSYNQDFKAMMSLVLDKDISFIPTSLKPTHNGEFVVAQNGTDIAVIDSEVIDAIEFKIENSQTGWLDGFLLYNVVDGKLVVRDFDGSNYRELSTGLADNSPAVISGNDRWIYYVNTESELVREKL